MLKVGAYVRVAEDALNLLPFSSTPEIVWEIMEIEGDLLTIRRASGNGGEEMFLYAVTDKMIVLLE